MSALQFLCAFARGLTLHLSQGVVPYVPLPLGRGGGPQAPPTSGNLRESRRETSDEERAIVMGITLLAIGAVAAPPGHGHQ